MSTHLIDQVRLSASIPFVKQVTTSQPHLSYTHLSFSLCDPIFWRAPYLGLCSYIFGCHFGRARGI